MAQERLIIVVLTSQLESVFYCLPTVSRQSLSCGFIHLHRNDFDNNYLENDIFSYQIR